MSADIGEPKKFKVEYYSCINPDKDCNFLYSFDGTNYFCIAGLQKLNDYGFPPYIFTMNDDYKKYSQKLETHEVIKYKLLGYL